MNSSGTVMGNTTGEGGQNNNFLHTNDPGRGGGKVGESGDQLNNVASGQAGGEQMQNPVFSVAG